MRSFGVSLFFPSVSVSFCFVRAEAATREEEKTRKGTGKLEGLNTDIECKPWGASKTRGKGE